MDTRIDPDVISVEGPAGLAAALASELAQITYRQLDHWARQGWVRPSVDPGEGRAGRRRYSSGDVERMALLRHLAKSGVNMSVAGPLVAGFGIPVGDVLVQWGPAGQASPTLRVVPAADLRHQATAEGAWVTFDPRAIRARLADSPTADPAAAPERRTA
jgi:DNA-binding transcriptional MerR regulator